MLDSIWTFSPWAAFFFFAIGLSLWETVAARAALRLGSDLPRRRPFVFGAWAGFAFGLALLVYFFNVSTAALAGVEGSASTVWEKARIAAFPTTWFQTGTANWVDGVCLLIQETIFGIACGRVLQKTSTFAPKNDGANADSNGGETSDR